MEWMVLRNYEGLPFYNRAKDIDITVHKKNFGRAYKIISEILSKAGFSLKIFTKFQYVWCFTFFNISDRKPLSLKIDIVEPFVWRGADIFEFDELYDSKVQYGNIYVPSKSFDGLMLLIKPLMTGGIIKEKYRKDILNSFNQDPEYFCSILSKKFSDRLMHKVRPHLEKGQLENIIRYKNKMRSYGWFNAFRHNPIKTISSSIEHFIVEIKRRSKRPYGSFIAVLGPDGSGKSTIAEMLRDELCRIMVKDDPDVKIVHFRPSIFPNLKKLISKMMRINYDENKDEFTIPHRAVPAGLLSSFLRLVYYWLDYIIGYWFHIRKKCIAGKIFIFDRYFYDFIVDPLRSRIKLPELIRSLFLKMTPKPDIVYFLNCDAKTILSRKRELPEEEIIRQLNVYKALAMKYKNFYSVNSEKKADEILNDIVIEYIKRNSMPI